MLCYSEFPGYIVPKSSQSVAKRSLLTLTWPIFIDLFFIFMINIIDAWFLSLKSDSAAASIGAVMPILGIAFALYSTMHQGGSSIASQLIGAGDHNKLAATYGVLFAILLFIGILLSIVMMAFAPVFAQWMDLNHDMAGMASIYLSTIAMGTAILAVRFAAAAILYGFDISSGVQIKVAHYIGAKRFEEADKQLMLGLKLGIAGAMFFVLTLLEFSDPLFAIFTSNIQIWALGKLILIIAIIGEFGRSFNLIIGASLRTSDDARYVSMVGFIIIWFMTLPLAWLLGLHYGYGLVGIWLATSVDECIRGIIALKR
jgi:Na+-driven multidrug efflux pump